MDGAATNFTQHDAYLSAHKAEKNIIDAVAEHSEGEKEQNQVSASSRFLVVATAEQKLIAVNIVVGQHARSSQTTQSRQTQRSQSGPH